MDGILSTCSLAFFSEHGCVRVCAILLCDCRGIPPHPEEEASVDSLEPSFFEAEELMRLLLAVGFGANPPKLPGARDADEGMRPINHATGGFL